MRLVRIPHILFEVLSTMSIRHRAIICVEACRVSWKFNSMCQHPEPLHLLHNSFPFLPMHSCTVWYVLNVNVVIVAPGVIYRVFEWKKCIGLWGWKDWNFEAEAGESGEPLNSPISRLRLRLTSRMGFNQPTNPSHWSASCCLGTYQHWPCTRSFQMSKCWMAPSKNLLAIAQVPSSCNYLL